MNQTDIPFVQGSDTSEAAARSKRDTATSDAERVFAYIRSQGEHGSTDDEIELSLGFSHQNASARRNGLVRAGRVKDSGLRRSTRSGRKATVWVVGLGVPVEGAPFARVTRPSDTDLRAAADALMQRSGTIAEVTTWDRVALWLRSISSDV